jgi:hypothetical protein
LGGFQFKASRETTFQLGVVAHPCHSSYTGGINSRIMVETSQGKQPEYLFEKHVKQKGWECDSSGRVHA